MVGNKTYNGFMHSVYIFYSMQINYFFPIILAETDKFVKQTYRPWTILSPVKRSKESLWTEQFIYC